MRELLRWKRNTSSRVIPELSVAFCIFRPGSRTTFIRLSSKVKKRGVFCPIFLLPPLSPKKAFHQNCRVQTEYADDNTTPISIQAIVPYEVLDTLPVEDDDGPSVLLLPSQGGEGFVGRLLSNTRFVIGLTIIVGLSASYTTDLASWKALVEVFQ